MTETRITYETESDNLTLMELTDLKLDLDACPAWADFAESSNEELANQISGQIEGKVDGYIMVMKRADSEVADLDVIVKACQARKKSIQKNNNRLKDILGMAMKRLGVESLKGKIPKFSASFRKPTQSVKVSDLSALPDGTFESIRIADNVEIKSRLKAGLDVPGAELVYGSESLTIHKGT